MSKKKELKEKKSKTNTIGVPSPRDAFLYTTKFTDDGEAYFDPDASEDDYETD